jgi:hypothetical protein
MAVHVAKAGLDEGDPGQHGSDHQKQAGDGSRRAMADGAAERPAIRKPISGRKTMA